ncbi:MAG: PhzF family phenazine biosynthesis protein [Planctomycetota bacterium]
MQPANIYHVDAFTSVPFSGNQAAVVVLERPADEAWMQRLADDMNLSETAYVVKPQDPVAPDAAWGLRWFTPAAEVDLCGHATLSSAHIVWDERLAPEEEPLRFATRAAGTLTCQRGKHGVIEMDFPADPPQPADAPPAVIEALGVTPVATYRSKYDWIVEVDSPQAVADAEPAFQALGRVPDTRGVAITAPGAFHDSPTTLDGQSPDFVSRFFAPSLRINEDPVTGSLHCVLGPLWSARLDKPALIGHQCSRRSGLVHVTHDKPDADRVTLAGNAVTLVNGIVTRPVVEA